MIAPERRNKMLRALSDAQIEQARIWYHVNNKPIKWIARQFTNPHTGQRVSQFTVWRWVVNISKEDIQALRAEHTPSPTP